MSADSGRPRYGRHKIQNSIGSLAPGYNSWMEGLKSGPRADRRSRSRTVAWGALRVIGSCAALLALYYELPLDSSLIWAAIMLSVGLVVFVALVGFQARLISRSPFPGLRAVEALAMSVPFFLLLFAGAYYVMERDSAGSFTQPLTRTDALYFTVTVISTVGFGDLTPRSQVARLVVTVQMIADLVILGLGIKIIVGAVKSRRQEQQQPDDTGVAGEDHEGRKHRKQA